MQKRIATRLAPIAAFVLVAGLAGCQGTSETARADPADSIGNARDSTIPNTALGARNNQGTTSREREPGTGVSVPLG